MVWLFKSSLLSVELGMGADCWTEHLSSLNVVQASHRRSPEKRAGILSDTKGLCSLGPWPPHLQTKKAELHLAAVKHVEQECVLSQSINPQGLSLSFPERPHHHYTKADFKGSHVLWSLPELYPGCVPMCEVWYLLLLWLQGCSISHFVGLC